MNNTSKEMTRSEELARKLELVENQHIKKYLTDWIAKSEKYADMMIQKYGFNKVQQTRDSYRLLFILNHLCPMLHHFNKKPNPSIYSVSEFNKLYQKHMLENTQVRVTDNNGELIQKGVEYTDKEWEAFIYVLGLIIPKTDL